MHRLPKHAYIVLDDLMLLSEVGLTQIDHVVVSVYGIFVIETKNYSGRITGTPRADFWTQHLHGKYNSFRNPFRQNYAHICALQSILDLPEQDAFVSIVAFADSAELEIQTEEELVHFTTLRKRIRAYREVQFSWETARVMAGTILLSNLDSKAARKQHLEQIDTDIAYQNFALRHGLCPRCGGTLVLRNGSYGTFYGCSNFPVCRYILQNDL